MDPKSVQDQDRDQNISSSENDNITVVCDKPPPNPQFRQIHSVRLPPKTTTFEKLKQKLSEIFFPDDPLYPFKNQTCFKKFVLGLQYFFPILHWAPHYNHNLFRCDVVAGLTIASLAIPQGISYGKLAHLPPIVGLYSSFVPPLIYAVLGSSKHLGIGPMSISSLVMGTMLSEVADPIRDQHFYLRLAYTSTFFAGVFQAALGFFRLGFIIDFLSKATLTGFMAGSAVIVSLQQFKGLLNIAHFTSKMQIIPVASSVFTHTDEWNWKTAVMGVIFLAILLATKQISSKKPKLFWISAITPLSSVIISTLLIFLLKSHFRDVAIIGKLPKGLNPPSVNMLLLNGPHVNSAVKTGITTGILSLMEGIATGRTLGAMENYQIDGNKEMFAIGVMNIVGCCTSCYVTSGSFSRSAVNYNAGGRTAFSNIVMAITVLITLLFLTPLFHYTPNLILSAIIITAVVGLIDFQAFWHLWKLDKLDFLSCLCSFFGVLFISVQTGLAIAVGISVFKIILHVTRPNTVALGNIAGTQLYLSLTRYNNTSRIPSFLILSIESPIFFANATYLQERIQRWVRDERVRIQETNEAELRCVILDMTAVSNIDTSGIDAIAALSKAMEKRSLQLALINPVAIVMEKLHHSKVLDMFERRGLYLTVGEAIADISSSWEDLQQQQQP